MAAQKRHRPLIRYAGSAAETSIRSKPIGRELNTEFYSKRHFCQASLAMTQSRTYLPALRRTAEPKAGEIHVTIWPGETFGSVHTEYSSQSNAPHMSGEQRTFTNGRIIVTGGRVRRGKQKRADYLLYYRRDYPLAIVEAKELGQPADL